MTGEWEYKLKKIESGKIDRKVFINEIRKTVSEIIDKAKSYTSSTIPGEYATLSVPCPSCSKVVKETYKMFNKDISKVDKDLPEPSPHDVPGDWFKGPF